MSSNTRSPWLTAVVTTTVALVLVAVSLVVGRVSATAGVTPGTNSAEAGFARDMQVHHAQAVEMSMLVRDRTLDEEVRLLAYDIATTQAQQGGQMYAWLAVWGLPQASPGPAMTWMARPVPGAGGAHDHAASADGAEVPTTMPGFASDAQIAALTAEEGTGAEVLFLELMIAHHEGGVDMAEAVVERTSDPTVLNLAGSMVSSQLSEISLMEDLLAARTGA